MLDRADGTGVTTYARALHAAQRSLSAHAGLLTASHQGDGRARRYGGAVRGIAGLPLAREGNMLVGHDIFRRAHIHWRLAGRLLELRPPTPDGLIHWTYPLPIRITGWVNIYTVHDVIPLATPHLSEVRHARLARTIRAICSIADRVVCVTDAARRDILSLVRCDPDRLVNCGQAVDGPGDAALTVPADLPSGGYFLFYGAIKPRKNIARLLDAYRASGVDLPLVMAGPETAQSAALLEKMASTPGVIRVPYQSRDALRALLGHAKALLFPSLAEGFGLPALEAMAAGIPVLTSDIAVLREVTDGAALLTNPFDVTAMASALARLASDRALCGTLAAAGRARAAVYSPQHFVAALGRVYAEAFAAR